MALAAVLKEGAGRLKIWVAGLCSRAMHDRTHRAVGQSTQQGRACAWGGTMGRQQRSRQAAWHCSPAIDTASSRIRGQEHCAARNHVERAGGRAGGGGAAEPEHPGPGRWATGRPGQADRHPGHWCARQHSRCPTAPGRPPPADPACHACRKRCAPRPGLAAAARRRPPPLTARPLPAPRPQAWRAAGRPRSCSA